MPDKTKPDSAAPTAFTGERPDLIARDAKPVRKAAPKPAASTVAATSTAGTK